MNETELRNKLLSNLQEFNNAELNIGSEVPIPYKHIYLPDIKNKLEVWCFKQDIVIYKALYNKDVGYRDAKIAANNCELIQVVLEKDNAQNTHPVGLPYVIIETKHGQPNTHEILAYSQKVQMIKTIFPYCKFIFLIFGKISARTYRHGLYFDKIIGIENVDSAKELKDLKLEISNLLKEANDNIIKLNK